MTIEQNLEKAMTGIYEVRSLCYDILKELKALKSRQTTTPRLGEQDPNKG